MLKANTIAEWELLSTDTLFILAPLLTSAFIINSTLTLIWVVSAVTLVSLALLLNHFKVKLAKLTIAVLDSAYLYVVTGLAQLPKLTMRPTIRLVTKLLRMHND